MPRYTLRARESLAVVLLFLGFVCAPVMSAGAEAARHELKIPSLPLEESLQELARQSGIQIVFLSRLTAGLRAPELAGAYTLDSAMERLLAGSGLEFRIVNPQ